MRCPDVYWFFLQFYEIIKWIKPLKKSGGRSSTINTPCSASPLPDLGRSRCYNWSRIFPEALALRILSTCECNTQEIDTTHCFQKTKRSSPISLPLFFKTRGLALLRILCAANHVQNDHTNADSGNIIPTFLLTCPVLTDRFRSLPANPIWISNQMQCQSSCSFTVEHWNGSNGMCALDIFREEDGVKIMKLNTLLQLWAGCLNELWNIKGFVLSESRKKSFK